MKFKIGLVGCGYIGKKRAASLGDRGELVACADLNFASAQELASKYANVIPFNSWLEMLNKADIDIVIVSTLHDSLAEITLNSLTKQKHVLVEKPAARSRKELLPILNYSQTSNLKVHVGFNHRYHRSIQKAKSLINDGSLGELMFIRGRYGHGGRIGYEKEWRAEKSISGGGELIDQGPHLIDLSQWFFGSKLKYLSSVVDTYYWDMMVDDNAFLTLQTEKGQTSFLHVSCTEWKNMFSMEIYGKRGKLEINGLGGSYGVEKLTHYNMLEEMGPPETSEWEYPEADSSWSVEMNDFFNDIENNNEPEANLETTLNCMEVIEKIYKDSKYDFSS